MSKAEERALEAYPKETRDISGFVIDIGHPQYMRDLYIEGYSQAEKDNELNWEDLKMIDEISDQVYAECDVDAFDEKEYYQEVLKRFNKGMRNK
jgi:hypothetical protein